MKLSSLLAVWLPLIGLACDDANNRVVLQPLEAQPPQIDWSRADAPQRAVSRSTGGPETDVPAMAPANLGANQEGPKQWNEPPPMKIDVNKKYTATIATDRGDIVLELYAKEAPMTVNNFVFLSREGFYNDIRFHRVIQAFMIQGGDPTGTGAGGPGYRFADEVDPKKNPHLFDKPGVLAMANAGPATNGSQFFITHVPTPHLNGKHTIFGQVTQGQEVVNAIRQGDRIKSIKIEEK